MSKYLPQLNKFQDFDRKQSKQERVDAKYLIPKELNFEQAICFKSLVEFIQQDTGKQMMLLKGYAGTGKTYLITKLLDYFFTTRPNQQIAMTAPTNKAVKILRRSSQITKECVTFATIHSLLGLREQITENGDQIFVQANTDTPNIINFKLLIIDEVSMLPDDLFLKINNYAGQVKIIFTGDSAQIPPVMKHDCIPFCEPENYDIKTIELTEIMRQKKGNPIIETSFAIRENQTSHNLPIVRTTNLNEDGKGVIHINSGNEDERAAFIKTLEDYFHCDAFKNNSDYAKVISWTNKSVNQMNRLIRKMIFGEEMNMSLLPLPKVMIGEKLIANKPIIKIDSKLGKIIQFSTNDEFEVISYEILTDKRFFFYYNTVVEEVLISGEKVRKNIIILHEDSEPEYNKKLNEIKNAAMRETDPMRKRSEWRYFYDFQSEYANIGYNYAISAHKSQGSSYTNTFILEDDIDQNKKVIERNRIKYTACTRATDKLFLISKTV